MADAIGTPPAEKSGLWSWALILKIARRAPQLFSISIQHFQQLFHGSLLHTHLRDSEEENQNEPPNCWKLLRFKNCHRGAISESNANRNGHGYGVRGTGVEAGPAVFCDLANSLECQQNFADDDLVNWLDLVWICICIWTRLDSIRLLRHLWE